MFTPRTETEWLVDTLRMDGLDAWVADEAGRVIAGKAAGAHPDRHVLLTQSETGGCWNLSLSLGRSMRLDFGDVAVADVAGYCHQLLEETP